MANIIGVTGIAQPIDTLSDQDTFPITYANKIKGGYKTVSTIADRDAIPLERRDRDLILVTENNTIYQWNGTSYTDNIKQYIGLGNIDNTSDVNKPISTATQIALNTKLNINQAVTVGTSLGVYNAATNTYTNNDGSTGNLSATPLGSFTNGSYYTVVTPGNISFTGLNFTSGTTFNTGDLIVVYGTQWGRTPFAIGDNTVTVNKTTFLKEVADNTKGISKATVLKSGKVISAVKADGSFINTDFQSVKTKSNTNESSITELQTSINEITPKLGVISSFVEVADNVQGIKSAVVLKSGKVIYGATKDRIVSSVISQIESDLSSLSPEPRQMNQYGTLRTWAFANGKVGLSIRSNGILVPKVEEYSKWVNESDANILVPNKLFVIDNRPIQLFAKSMFSTFNDSVGEFEISITSKNSQNFVYSSIFQKSVLIDSNRLGTTARIAVKTTKDNDFEIVKDVTIVKSSSTKTNTTKTVMLIGDSLFGSANNATVDAVKSILDLYSTSVTFVGKRKLSGVSTYSEGRSGWASSDLTYINTRKSPLSVGSEAGYTDTDDRNPFIRVATGTDPVEDIKNGYIFDFQFYLTRFGITAPSVMVIDHITNDLGLYGYTTGVTNAIESYRIIISSILSVNPDCKIGITLPITGWANRYFKNESYEKYQAIVSLYKQLQSIYASNANVDIIASHAYLTTDFIFPLTETAISGTNLNKGVVSDMTHFVYTDSGKFMFAEPIANYIHSQL